MRKKKFISWRRVSTKKQGRSGLGLAAQADIIDYFVKVEGGELIADYEEVYTGKDLEGCKELRRAMEHCKRDDAVLIIAKTDRFRNTAEALQIYDDMHGDIYFCDLPHTDKFTLTLFFALAEREALQVSIRTKAALKASRLKIEQAKEDKTNIFFKTCMERIEAGNGITFGRGCEQRWYAILADELNAYNVRTSSGGTWDVKKCRDTARRIKNRYGIAW